MLELFRLDAATQVQALNAGLLALERAPAAAEQLEACMRAAHSIKGAARVVGIGAGAGVAHAMEDCFVAAQRGDLTLHRPQIDLLLRGVDLLSRIANTPESEIAVWSGEKKSDVDGVLADLAIVLENGGDLEPAEGRASLPDDAETVAAPRETSEVVEGHDRVLRVSAHNLDRLMGMAGESLVESRRLKAYAESLLRIKRLQDGTSKAFEVLREALLEQPRTERIETALSEAQRKILEMRELIAERLAERGVFDRRSTNLAHRLYDEALATRMRPFSDGVRAFPRMVRDLARELDKHVRLEIIGAATRLDRDILDGLETPLGHLLRNAIDHGIESADERREAGKRVEGVVSLEARHSGGMLQIVVSDDGRGIDLEQVREAVVARGLTNAEMATTLSEAELLEFLFLPGFTMKGAVTQISGRGVGLDVVQNMIKQVHGSIHVSSRPGKGTRFQLLLPLSLSVVRALLVEIGGEPYAFPLASIVRTMMLPREQIELLEGRQLFTFNGQSVGMVSAVQLLNGTKATSSDEELSVIVLGEGEGEDVYGLVADRFLSERELVVQPLEARLGKIKDIAAGALMEDGSPVLIVDVDDVLRSLGKLAASGHVSSVQRTEAGASKYKRVLVVDDSLTVRELERKLLGNVGYDVEVAVDGMDAWNAVRSRAFDLIVTDVDMPRMDGIELVSLIKKDPNLASMPVMIVSYKDREEDRRRGLDAGADYYLTKGSFHDETLLEAVVDLIGAAGE